MRGAFLRTIAHAQLFVSAPRFVSHSPRRNSSFQRFQSFCVFRSVMAGVSQGAFAREPVAEPLVSPSLGDKYKIALCQLAVGPDKEVNILRAKDAIEAAADKGAQLIVLPEMWNCPYSNSSFPIFAEEIDEAGNVGPSYAMLSHIALKKGVTVIGGSIPERSNGHLYNTCYVFGKNGKVKGRHRKVHLFDIDIPGKITFKESDILTEGDGLTVVDTDVGRIGIGICYDIRFPEMAMIYASRGVHLIAYPGAFNMTTGPVHWELLQKARHWMLHELNSTRGIQL